MSVSPESQSPLEWGVGRQSYLTKVRKVRSRALELALAVERLEGALNTCSHWKASQEPHKAPEVLGTYLCCSRIRDAQKACTAAYGALQAEVDHA